MIFSFVLVAAIGMLFRTFWQIDLSLVLGYGNRLLLDYENHRYIDGPQKADTSLMMIDEEEVSLRLMEEVSLVLTSLMDHVNDLVPESFVGSISDVGAIVPPVMVPPSFQYWLDS